MATRMPAVWRAVGHLGVGHDVGVFDAVDLLQLQDEVAEGGVLLGGEGAVVVAHDLDADGDVVKVAAASPHAHAAVVGHSRAVDDAVDLAIAVDAIVRLAVLGEFAKGGLGLAFGGVKDDELGGVAAGALPVAG